MKKRRDSLIRSVFGLCVIALALAANADPGKPPKKPADNQPDKPEKNLPPLPLQLGDASKPEISYAWRELESGRVVVSVWNTSKEQQKISASLTDFDLAAGSTGQGPATIHLTISPDSSIAAGYGVSRFTLKLRDPAPVPPVRGSYSGVLLVLGDTDKFSSVSQRIRINVAGPQPAVTKATFIAWRLAPFLPAWCASIKVPLTDEYKPAEFTDLGRIVGFVHRPYGGIATVRWTSLEPAQGGRPARAHLEIEDLPAAGQYDGDIYLGGLQDKTAPLALIVVGKDVPVFPILVMAFGIFLAWLTKRYLGVLRSVWVLRKQEAELGSTFQKSQEAFADAARGKSCAAYSVADDVTQQRRAIRKDLQQAERSWATSLDSNQNYKNALKNIQDLQDQLSQWAKAGSELATLESSLEVVQEHIGGSAMIPPAADPGDPAFLAAAQDLLRGRALQASDISTLRKAVSDATTTATQFDSANQHAQELAASFRSTKERSDLNNDQKSKLADIQNRLVAAWEHLWSARTAGDIATITGVGGDLDQAQVELAQIAAEPQKPRRFQVASLTSFLLSPTDHWDGAQILTAATDLDHPGASDIRRAETLDRGIRLGDLGSVVIASVIALVTGLSSNYLGKPFGTVQDYFSLFVWGAGTKVGLDIVTSALDKLVAWSPSKSS